MTHELDARLADARLHRLEGKPGSPEANGAAAHLLFVPLPAGYELVDCVGDSPAAGELLVLEERAGRYAVLRIVRSPLPGDERPCAYLELI